MESREIGSQRQERILRPEDVANAESDRFLHPILAIINESRPKIIGLQGDFGNASAEASLHYGFFADEFVAAGPFKLSSIDMIGIWSSVLKVDEIGLYQRYALARAISSAYCVQGIADEKWKAFPRLITIGSRLPNQLVGDRRGLTHVESAFKQIEGSVNTIGSYIDATGEKAASYQSQLGDSIGPQSAGNVSRSQRNCLDFALSEVFENFGPALGSLSFALNGG